MTGRIPPGYLAALQSRARCAPPEGDGVSSVMSPFIIWVLPNCSPGFAPECGGCGETCGPGNRPTCGEGNISQEAPCLIVHRALLDRASSAFERLSAENTVNAGRPREHRGRALHGKALETWLRAEVRLVGKRSAGGAQARRAFRASGPGVHGPRGNYLTQWALGAGKYVFFASVVHFLPLFHCSRSEMCRTDAGG